jgi:hypothetical protein
MPYRNRQHVDHVSLPPRALQYALQQGAQWWVVRLDDIGECYGFPLKQALSQGWLQTSEGKPECFVPLSSFQPLAWQNWSFVNEKVFLDEEGGPATPGTLGLRPTAGPCPQLALPIGGQ